MATSKLQRRVGQLLSTHLGQYTIQENTRPDWLITSRGERLELDFYIKELQVAIEVQGAQHYIYVPHFHKTHDNFCRRLKWDSFKREQCSKQGVQLIEIDNEQDAIMIVERFLPEGKESCMPLAKIGRFITSPCKLQKPKGRYYILACMSKYRRKVKRERAGLNRQNRIEKLTRQLKKKLEINAA